LKTFTVTLNVQYENEDDLGIEVDEAYVEDDIQTGWQYPNAYSVNVDRVIPKEASEDSELIKARRGVATASVTDRSTSGGKEG
jgi:hypothetical protein